MTNEIFLVAKGFCYGRHYTALATFILKQPRIEKVLSMNADRCLEFMTDDDTSIEFVCREKVIYARPGQDDPETKGIEVVIRNITSHDQLTVISELIANGNASTLVKTLRELESGMIMRYTHKSKKDITIFGIADNGGNTVVFDGRNG